jgi:hypothetical protein
LPEKFYQLQVQQSDTIPSQLPLIYGNSRSSNSTTVNGLGLQQDTLGMRDFGYVAQAALPDSLVGRPSNATEKTYKSALSRVKDYLSTEVAGSEPSLPV